MDAEWKRRLVRGFRWADPGPWSAHYLTDRSGWWRDPVLLAGIGPALAEEFRADEPTLVIGPERSGLLLGPLVATALGVGFAEAYKDISDAVVGDQLHIRATSPDHRGRTGTLSVRRRWLDPSDRVLVVDDWIETGAQATALAGIVADADATYLGTAVILNALPPHASERLTVRGLLHPGDLDD
ncbi:MAG TPA: phosphoribosyltransferase family protein [Cryptosporangiaceae bacterium]|nr:phosphoribosyltransferase family protein [Cryptosporangiaceae bacterium]